MSDEAFVQEVCGRELGAEPTEIRRLSSLTNSVFRLDFAGRKPLIFKVINQLDPNRFLFWTAEAEALLTGAGFLNGLLLVKGPGFRIENFIPSRTVGTAEVRSPAARLLLTRPVARLHNLVPPRGRDSALILQAWRQEMPGIRAKIAANFAGSPREAEVAAMVAEMDEWILEVLAPHPSLAQTVLSHNDLLNGNLLFNTESRRYELIDFDYCGFSPRESDLYNQLIESTYDYDDAHPLGFLQDLSVFPGDAQLRELVRFYLFFRSHPDAHADLPDLEESLEVIRKDPGLAAVDAEEVEGFLKAMFVAGNIQNVLWAVFSFYLFRKEGVHLDYVEYALARFRDFRRCRARAEQGGQEGCP